MSCSRPGFHLEPAVDKWEVATEKFRGGARTPLMNAATRGDSDTVRELVKCGANVNESNQHGRTALHLAAVAGNAATVRLLVEEGSNVDSLDRDNCTALMLAAPLGHAETISTLISLGAKVNQVAHNGVTALMLAAGRGQVETVQVLLDSGAAINHVDQDGRTALMISVGWQRLKTVRILVDRGADFLVTAGGETALSLARAMPNTQIEAILEDAKRELESRKNVERLRSKKRGGPVANLVVYSEEAAAAAEAATAQLLAECEAEERHKLAAQVNRRRKKGKGKLTAPSPEAAPLGSSGEVPRELCGGSPSVVSEDATIRSVQNECGSGASALLESSSVLQAKVSAVSGSTEEALEDDVEGGSARHSATVKQQQDGAGGSTSALSRSAKERQRKQKQRQRKVEETLRALQRYLACSLVLTPPEVQELIAKGERCVRYDTTSELRVLLDRARQRFHQTHGDRSSTVESEAQRLEQAWVHLRTTDTTGEEGCPESIQHGLAALEDSLKCVVCIEKRKNVVVLPCKHMSTCTDCTNTLHTKARASKSAFTCPICRAIVHEHLTIFQ